MSGETHRQHPLMLLTCGATGPLLLLGFFLATAATANSQTWRVQLTGTPEARSARRKVDLHVRDDRVELRPLSHYGPAIPTTEIAEVAYDNVSWSYRRYFDSASPTGYGALGQLLLMVSRLLERKR